MRARNVAIALAAVVTGLLSMSGPAIADTNVVANSEGAAGAEQPRIDDSARAHYERAESLRSREQYASAAAEYLAAYERRPEIALLHEAASAFRLAGSRAQAAKYYRRYMRAHPGELIARMRDLRRALGIETDSTVTKKTI